MAVAFVKFSQIANGTTSVTTVPVPAPAGGVAAGSLLLMAVSIRTTTGVITPPAGWTEVPVSTNTAGTTCQLRVYKKVATGSEPSTYTVTFDVAQRHSIIILNYSDATVGNASGAATTVAGTTHITASVTPAATSNWLVTFWSAPCSATWNGWAPDPIGDVERTELKGGSSSTNLALAADDSNGQVGTTSPVIRMGTSVDAAISVQIAVLLASGDPLPHTVKAKAITSGEAWGRPTIVKTPPPPKTVHPTSITSGEAWGHPTILHVSPLDQTVKPIAIPTGEAWGRPTILAAPPPDQSVEPVGIPTGEAWGHPTILHVSPLDQTVKPVGIPTREAWGTRRIVAEPPADHTVKPVGIPSGEAWGTPTILHVSPKDQTVSPTAIPSGEAWGTPRIIHGDVPHQDVLPVGIPSREAWGRPRIISELPPEQVVAPVGIVTGELWGTPRIVHVSPKDQVVGPIGITSREAWGRPRIRKGPPPPPGGQCDLWPVVVDEGCCPGWSALPLGLRESALRLAVTTLWAATGRRYGLCQVTVRPCEVFCLSCGTDRPHTVALPFRLADGGMVSCDCSCSTSCCTSACATLLSLGPVYQVQAVRVHGMDLWPEEWTVLNSRFLLRNEGCWPKCQDLTLPDTEPGTWSVTYLRGIPVPPEGLWAAGMLACEIAKQCSGQKCRLPSRVTQLSRDGMTMTLLDKMEFMDKGLTGLPEVDRWIRSVNPHGLAQPPQIWSPDMPDPWMTTG